MATKSPLTKTINLKLQYDLYTKSIVDKVEELKLEVKTNTVKRNKLLVILEKYSTYISQAYSISIENLKELRNDSFIQPLSFIEEKPLITIYLKNVVKLNSAIKADTNAIIRVSAKLISFKFYKTVIEKFNDKVVDAIVEEDYYFCPSPSFGAMFIVRSNQKRKQIDWGKSTKMKNNLIAAGKIPYYKADAEAAEARGEEYNGVKWIIHRPDLNFFFYWFIFRGMKKFVPIIKDYAFTPSRSQSFDSPVIKLQKVKDDLHKASLLYTRKLNYSPNVTETIS